MGAKKTITVSNHWGPMIFTLFTDKETLITGKTKFLVGTESKANKADSKKIALVFKYDKSGILRGL